MRANNMVCVSVRSNSVVVEGHAGYNPGGPDVVCAAVSTLIDTLAQCLVDLAEDDTHYYAESGFVRIDWEGKLSDKGSLLVDAFYLGVCMVAEAYPNHIQVQ